jgi:hypothetical protein
MAEVEKKSHACLGKRLGRDTNIKRKQERQMRVKG